jgi:CRISPR type I-D-associated protein Csc2
MTITVPKETEKMVKKGFLKADLTLKPSADRVTFVLLRTVKDRAILQTEGDFTLDKVIVGSGEAAKEKVEFMSTKQKAVERRQHMAMLRSAGYGDCIIPNKLCLRCINCALFGGVRAEGGRAERYNLKSRILYSSAYSLQDAREITDTKTHNAVNEVTQSTGQALIEVEYVLPGAIFPSVTVIRDPTWYDFMSYLKVIQSATRFGARTAMGGEVENSLVAAVFSKEFVATPLEFEGYVEEHLKKDGYPYSEVQQVSGEFIKAVSTDEDTVIMGKPLENLMQEARAFDFSKKVVEELNKQTKKKIDEVMKEAE